jgi:hypothetical protein
MNRFFGLDMPKYQKKTGHETKSEKGNKDKDKWFEKNSAPNTSPWFL